jgi:dinuclear metal center YbgI/SA1388 family protein
VRRPLVADLVDALGRAMPPAWAEPWDAVGLLVGDAGAAVSRVLVTLDPTHASLAEAVSTGANVLLTHHPAFRSTPARLTAGDGAAGLPFAAAAAGVALISQHTNLDRAPDGADALPLALGLEISGPLEQSAQDVAVLVTYAPASSAEAVLAALTRAGAGRIGHYGGCSFSSEGTGRFTPLDGSAPCAGEAGKPSSVDEVRIEAVCARDATDAVAAAVRAVHPYEEPVMTTHEATLSRGAARLGRVCLASKGASVGSLAQLVSARLGVKARVWGDAGRGVSRIAVAPGSGRSLLEDAMREGCDAFVTGELRYHEALDAAARGLAVIEAGHDATEWPLVPVLAEAARTTSGLAADAVIVGGRPNVWWTAEGN